MPWKGLEALSVKGEGQWPASYELSVCGNALWPAKAVWREEDCVAVCVSQLPSVWPLCVKA